MKLSVCSVATTKSLKEFELLKFTFEQYHEADRFVATDDYAAKALEKYDNVTIINSIKLDKTETKKMLGYPSFPHQDHV